MITVSLRTRRESCPSHSSCCDLLAILKTDNHTAEKSSTATNPYVAAILANMPTGLPRQPEESHSSLDVVCSQRSHKLHKEIELIEESISC